MTYAEFLSKKLKPSFDMGVNDKRAEQLYKQGGTPIE